MIQMKTSRFFLRQKHVTWLLACWMLCLLTACNRYALYQTTAPSSAPRPEPSDRLLTPGDKIAVSVWGHDELSVGSVHTVYSTPEEAGKWLMIDAAGELNLPQIGKVKVQGLTLKAAEEKLVPLYAQYVQKPVLNLRLMSNQVTVLGEVRDAGNYLFHTDRARLVDMIGKAGGFTDFARTNQIKIIRSTEVMVIDLTSSAANETMVNAQDVIYVPPGRNKSFDRVASKLIPLASLLTALALVYNVSVNK